MGKCVLLVEDHPLVRMSIERTLEAAGYSVTSASGGDDGLAKFKRAVPDLVITDIMMPGRDGIELILAIRRLHSAVPILAMSGYEATGKFDPLLLTLRLGADDAISKPFDSDELVAKVEHVLSRKRARAQRDLREDARSGQAPA